MDHRQVRLGISNDEMKAHARRAPAMLADLDLDVLVSLNPTDAGYGLARMFEGLAGDRLDHDYHAVRTPEEALTVLDLTPSVRRQLQEALSRP